MLNLLQYILPIFLNIILGTFIKRYWLKSEEFWRNLEKMSYYLLLPAALFNFTAHAQLDFYRQIRIAAILTTVSLIIMLGLYIYKKKYTIDNRKFTSVFQGSIRYNSYVFLSLGGSLLSPENVGILTIIASYMIIFTNIASVLMFSIVIEESDHSEHTKKSTLRKKLFLKLIKNPFIISILSAFAFNYADLSLTVGFKKFLDSLSVCAFCIGVIIVGAGLKFMIEKTNIQYILVANINKLIIFPLLTIIVIQIFNIQGCDREVCILYSCGPCASTTYILSKQLGGDPESMTAIITTTTIFSLLSLWIFLYIIW